MGMWEGGPKAVRVDLGEFAVVDELEDVLYNILEDDDEDFDDCVDADRQPTSLNIVANPDGSWKIVGVNDIPLDFTKRLRNV